MNGGGSPVTVPSRGPNRGFKVAMALLCLAGAGALALTRQPAAPAGPCAVAAGPIALKDVSEASGLAVSRRHPGILWSHNDSGNAPVLFAFDRDGAPRGRVRVPVAMRDWEDISAARCDDTDCLFLADIGDNRSVRDAVTLYRVPEPALGDSETAAPRRFTARYADGPHNAEAMFVLGSDAFVITRDRIGALYRGTIPADAGSIISLQPVGSLGLPTVTDAEAAPDGRSVVVRTSREAAFYRAAEITDGRATPYFRLRLDGWREPQGEAIAVDGHMLFLASEGGAVRGGQLLGLRCAAGSIEPR